ncbi:MAG: tetratricopeptide repeat protein [Elusimicrobia bacterium]|nr:tetratricopeptide repeat protein [Elusimicrobiota bacterium]
MATLAEFVQAGMAHFKAGQYAQALPCFGAALKANDHQPVVWSLAGICFLELDKTKEALDCFDQSVKLSPESAAMWSNRAQAYLRVERFEDALSDAEKALSIDAELPDAWNNKGVALRCIGTRDRQLGKLQEALRCFNQALARSPRHAQALKNKPQTVEQIRAVDEALNAPDPTTAEEWLKRGDTLGGPEQLRSYAKAVERDPALAKAWLRKALAEQQAGKPRDARYSLERFVETAGPEFAVELGQAKAALRMMRQEGVPSGELPEGMTDEKLREASRLTQQAAEQNEAKEYRKAANLAERALIENPASATAWFHKAYALDALGHDVEGLAAYDEALRLCPDYDDALKNKAALLCELKRFEESLPVWDLVIAAHPGEGTWLDQKAKALARMGRTEEAAELTMKALEDPSFAEAYDRRGQDMMRMMGVEPVKLSREEEAQALEALANRDMSQAPAAVRESGERLERQMSAKPADPEALAWIEKAKALLLKKGPEDLEKALGALEQALRLAPDLPLAFFLRGSANFLTARACAAARDMARFKTLAHADMARQIDAADSALAELQKAGISGEPEDPAERERLDEAFRRYDRSPGIGSVRTPQEALTLSEAVLRLNPKHARAWLSKGQALEELGRGAEAIGCFMEAGRLSGDLVPAFEGAVRIHAMEGRTADAIAVCDEALAGALCAEGRVEMRVLRALALLAEPSRAAEGVAEADALLRDPGLPEKHRQRLVQSRSGLRAGPEAQAVESHGSGQAVAAAAADAPAAPGAEGPGESFRAPSATPAARASGELIGGKYEVLGKVGEGGFGVVYQVYSRETRMVYALKTFREEYLTDAGTRDLFKREAQVWLDLGAHPFVVRAHFVDEMNGRLYIAMEYLPGDSTRPNSLDGWLKRGPVALEQVLRWSVQFCHGMEHAAKRGVQAHRDIKPANILVARDGTLRISDFGLAAALNLAKSANRLGIRAEGEVGLSCMSEGGAGTPPYMPPEQFSADSRCDARSDVYAFGVTLYQLLSGRFPLMPRPPGRSPEEGRRFWNEMRMMASSVPPPPLDTPLWPVLARCLEKSPDRRFSGFAELRAPLEEALKSLTGETVVPPETGRMGATEWNNRGISLSDLERYDDAVACFDRALDSHPTDTLVLANKALALRGLGRFDQALACADKALALERANGATGASGTAWNHRGLVLLDQGRLEEAGEAFERAAAARPDLVDAWVNLGMVHGRLKRQQAALEAYDRALAVEPRSPGAWAGKAHSLEQVGRVDEAISAYVKALELDPRRFSAWLNLGILRRRKGDAAEALVCYKRAIELDPGNPILFFNVAVAEEDLKDMHVALKAYAEFLSLNPGPDLAAQVAHAKGRLEAALAGRSAAPPAGSVAEQSAEAMFVQAGDMLRAGEYAQALTTLNAALSRHGEPAKYWAARATALAALGKAEEALASLDKALEREQTAVWHATRAGLLVKLSRFHEAEGAAVAAFTADPKLGAAWGYQAMVMESRGERDSALQFFAKAVQLSPELFEFWRRKADLEEKAGRMQDAAVSLREYLRRLPPKDVVALDRAKEDLRRIESGGAKPTPQQIRDWLEKAAILLNQGRWELAREPLARALAAEDSNPAAWRDLARCLLELGRHDEAERAAATSAEQDPADGESCVTRGQALAALKRPQEAVEAFDEALRRKPKLAKANIGKGQALLALAAAGGDAAALTTDALAEFDRALELEPRNFHARYLKGIAHHGLGQAEEAAKAYRQFLTTAPITQRAAMDEVRERLKALGAA